VGVTPLRGAPTTFRNWRRAHWAGSRDGRLREPAACLWMGASLARWLKPLTSRYELGGRGLRSRVPIRSPRKD
jgi:hypothetical protein